MLSRYVYTCIYIAVEPTNLGRAMTVSYSDMCVNPFPKNIFNMQPSRGPQIHEYRSNTLHQAFHWAAQKKNIMEIVFVAPSTIYLVVS